MYCTWVANALCAADSFCNACLSCMLLYVRFERVRHNTFCFLCLSTQQRQGRICMLLLACRTLTPFGFQAEERTLWEATDTYINMSPYLQAHKIKKPLLLIHGEDDNNTGAMPTLTSCMLSMLWSIQEHLQVYVKVSVQKVCRSYLRFAHCLIVNDKTFFQAGTNVSLA